MDLDEAADRLYGMVPEEFTTARDALAKETRAAGDAALAKQIKGLRRPAVVAWAVNQAARREGLLDPLLDLGRRLREAWRTQDAEALAEAGRERTRLVARAVRSVRENAEAAGRPLAPGAALEIEQTLDAAVVDEDAAEQVRRGRLTRPLSYSGFTPAPVVRPAPSAGGEEPAAAAKARGKAAGESRDAERRRAKAERERRVDDLGRALAEAEEAAAEAERSRAGWAAERAEAVREHERRVEKVETLTARLAKAKDKLDAASHRLDVARREETGAERAARSARLHADEAREALDAARSAED
ncbi:hypothetical protein F5972_17400 [Microbispora cellulosiformans]|uniref:Uncharacterized protein n=1 Tax=Microbispora cellulosiformans TaxID=2614688 RepID=A0A5J5JZN8_9ACTN|nr:hypothetical protein [Microbispora cellulosiformans]KAA9377426.1 hypothetical protein F5972_17400 [Microbispora cellulosiformans]